MMRETNARMRGSRAWFIMNRMGIAPRENTTRRVSSFLLALALMLSCDARAAGGPSLKHVLDGVQRRYENTQSFSASFTEEIQAVGSNKRERAGTMYLQKPGKMRWNFKAPDTETIVSDGTTLYNYDPDLDQVIETPLKQALASSSAAAFLLGVGKLQSEFDASIPPGSASSSVTRVLLTPRAGGNQIDLSVDPKTFEILALTLKDQLGNTTAISFSDIKWNVSMSDSLFTFKVPAGADIVTGPPSP
jgi:outer membrane lipoprotein carrier protein